MKALKKVGKGYHRDYRITLPIEQILSVASLRQNYDVVTPEAKVQGKPTPLEQKIAERTLQERRQRKGTDARVAAKATRNMDDPHAEMDFEQLGTEADSCCEIAHAVNECSIAVHKPCCSRHADNQHDHRQTRLCAQPEEGQAEDTSARISLRAAQAPCPPAAHEAGAGESCKVTASAKRRTRKRQGAARNRLDTVGGLSTGLGVLEPNSGTRKAGQDGDRAGAETAERAAPLSAARIKLHGLRSRIKAREESTNVLRSMAARFALGRSDAQVGACQY